MAQSDKKGRPQGRPSNKKQRTEYKKPAIIHKGKLAQFAGSPLPSDCERFIAKRKKEGKDTKGSWCS